MLQGRKLKHKKGNRKGFAVTELQIKLSLSLCPKPLGKRPHELTSPAPSAPELDRPEAFL